MTEFGGTDSLYYLTDSLYYLNVKYYDSLYLGRTKEDFLEIGMTEK